MLYDGAYTLTSNTRQDSEKGPFLSNGKIGLRFNADGSDTLESYVVTSNNNVTTTTDTFKFCKLRLFSSDDATTSTRANVNVQLRMDVGIATVSYDIIDVKQNGVVLARVEHDVYTHRTMTDLVVQTLRLTFTQAYIDDATAPDPCVYHEIVAPDGTDGTDGTYMSQDNEISQTIFSLTTNRMSISTGYVFEGNGMATVTDKKSQSSQSSQSSRSMKVIHFTRADLVVARTMRFHVVSSLCSSSTVLSRPEFGTMPHLREEHVRAWMAVWKVNMTLVVSPTEDNASQCKDMQGRIRLALYTLFSSPSVGHVGHMGDLFVTPMWLLLDPVIARERIEVVQESQQSQQSHKENTNSRASRAIRSLNAWNYYRVTKDIVWLREVGSVILRNAADYIVSIVTRRDDGLYTIYGTSNEDNTFTNYVCATTLKCAIECMYELSRQGHAKAAWHEVYASLVVPIVPKQVSMPSMLSTLSTLSTPSTPSMLSMHSSDDGTSAIDIAEPLLLMTPYFDTLYYALDASRRFSSSTIEATRKFYEARISPKLQTHPFNAIANSILKLRDPNYETFVGLASFARSNDWSFASESHPEFGDVELSAMFILAILTGPLGFRIRGGVTASRFYYEEMCKAAAPCAERVGLASLRTRHTVLRFCDGARTVSCEFAR